MTAKIKLTVEINGNMENFFKQAAMQNNPLRVLWDFLDKEDANEKAKNYDKLRFVGYVLEIGYDSVRLITSDPYKLAVGGLPRNSMLLMVPVNYKSLPPHFTLLRVTEAAPTPLSQETAQTYFELQKKSMPELDVFTQSELQWGALNTAVLGMFYVNPLDANSVEFSGDLNNFVSAHNYKVYAPSEELLDLIVNSLISRADRFRIGELRLTESRLRLHNAVDQNHIPVYVSTKDFLGTRTALFGKTRLGKSNVVKLIAASLIETFSEKTSVGQLIFDINGEYANDNPQDESKSLASAYPKQCVVYALNEKKNTRSKPLKVNFYENPETSIAILRALLLRDRRESIYVKNFANIILPPLSDLGLMEPGEKKRAQRRILMYWAILKRAGFDADVSKLQQKMILNSTYNRKFRETVYSSTEPQATPPIALNTLDEVLNEFIRISVFIREHPNDEILNSASGKPLFEADELALLNFLNPRAGAGPSILHSYLKYHDKDAGNFTKDILDYIEKGMTVILDLSNADPEVMEYFSQDLSYAIFRNQVDKFSNNKLESDSFVQLYFEEAHNLFPKNENDARDPIYKRLAKEGAKYHIGMVYSTQSVTGVSMDLLDQTENFFIAHLSSEGQVNALRSENIAYGSLTQDILQTKSVGYIRLLTRSHRFVIPTQAIKFSPKTQIENLG